MHARGMGALGRRWCPRMLLSPFSHPIHKLGISPSTMYCNVRGIEPPPNSTSFPARLSSSNPEPAPRSVQRPVRASINLENPSMHASARILFLFVITFSPCSGYRAWCQKTFPDSTPTRTPQSTCQHSPLPETLLPDQWRFRRGTAHRAKMRLELSTDDAKTMSGPPLIKQQA